MGLSQRDSFFGEIINAAMDDKDIVILSADSGAPAFDQFRKDRPDQWLHMGISEANMISVAAGLALSGKQVYCYAIIPFITGRCFDQTKVAIALQSLPVTLVGVGAGYSYDDGGPTHYGVEDIGIMRNLKRIEIWSPWDAETARETAKDCLARSVFRYVRLDRHVLPAVALLPFTHSTMIIGIGAMCQVACEVALQVGADGTGWAQNWPLLRSVPAPTDRVITVEEHFYSGGFGAAMSEWMHDHGDRRPLLRCAIPDQYEWENGGRQHLWKRAGLDTPTLVEKIRAWMT